MKRITVLTLSAFIFLFSCKKEHSANPAPQKYKVSFNVSGFTQQIINSAGGRASQVNTLKTNDVADLKSAISFLNYVVKNTAGVTVSKVSQDSSFTNFGNITDYLEAGSYTITFVGYKGALRTQFPQNDTFSQVIHITVSAGNITQAVSLHRVVGELTIDIADALPANASKIVLSVGEVQGYDYTYENTIGSVYTETVTFNLPPSVIGTTHYRRSVFMFNTNTTFTAIISCYDTSNKLIAQASVNNVSVQMNTQTILTGNLFAANNVFTVTLNKAWDPTPINIPF